MASSWTLLASSLVLVCLLPPPCLSARGDCATAHRPWKGCIAGVERCEGGYCVLRLWFVVVVALLGVAVTVSVLACSVSGWSEGLARIALVVTLLIMLGTLGIIITGTYFTYI